MLTTEKLPGEPIIIQTYVGSYNVVKESQSAIGAVRALLDHNEEPMYLIIDANQISIDFADIVSAASMTTDEMNVLFRDPRIRETIVISNSTLIQLSAKGGNTATFGNVELKVFDSLVQALAYARRQYRASSD